MSILSLWLCGAFAFTIARMVHLHRQQKLAKQHINELETSNIRLRHEKNRIEYLSLRDALTNAYNRQGIERIKEEFYEDPRVHHFALILLDIDHFKRVNDNHGHDVGDNVLNQFAGTIQRNIRSEDCFARWGGEEFMLLCPNLNQERTLLLAEKLRETLAQETFANNLKITASFGVGVNSDKAMHFDELFKQVDNALYKAKQQGRNCVIYADSP